MSWSEAYPKSNPLFKFEWKVADFVMNGKRLEKPNNMRKDVYELINESWCPDPKDRLTIEEVMFRLQEILKNK